MPTPDRPRIAVIVADIGGTKIALGHVYNGVPALEHSEFSSQLLRVADPASAVATHLQRYTAKHQLEVAAIVLGVPTSLSMNLQTILSSPNIPQLEGHDLGLEVSALLGVPVYLERDIGLLLLGEARVGSASGAGSVLGAFFGTGVGAAWLLNGRLHRGSSGAGLELGHIPMRGEGQPCLCGNTDCLEAYACGHTLRELAQRFEIEVSELFVKRHRHHDLSARLEEFVRDQAFALASAINLLDPQVVVIGGGVMQMLEYPFAQFQQIVTAHLRHPNPRSSVRLVAAALGNRAALWGALSVLEERQ